MSRDTPQASVEGGRAPTSETGSYVYVHEHSWVEVLSMRWPVGSWHPVFRCEVCGDEVCDLHVTDYIEPGSVIPA